MPTDESVTKSSVQFDDIAITCRHPDGGSERIEWDSLQEVLVRTVDAGLSFTNVFWVLTAKGTECVFPHGTAGDGALLKRLQALPGFNNEVFIAAMSSISDGEFVCWHRSAGG